MKTSAIKFNKDGTIKRLFYLTFDVFQRNQRSIISKICYLPEIFLIFKLHNERNFAQNLLFLECNDTFILIA